MLAEEACDGLCELVFCFADIRVAFAADKEHQPERVALGDDRRGDGGAVAVKRFRDKNAALIRRGLIDAAVLHDLLELGGDALADQIAARAAGSGDDAVTVGHGDGGAGGFAQGFTDLRSKLVNTAHERVLFKNHFALLAGIDLQRVAFADAHGAADFFRDDDSAQIVPLCQERDKKINDFFKKPGAAWFLSFLKR